MVERSATHLGLVSLRLENETTKRLLRSTPEPAHVLEPANDFAGTAGGRTCRDFLNTRQTTADQGHAPAPCGSWATAGDRAPELLIPFRPVQGQAPARIYALCGCIPA